MEKIRGGWAKVPEHLKTKTQLAREGLKPGDDPVAEVYSAREWRSLYDVNTAVAKRKQSDKQRESSIRSLEAARAKEQASRTCDVCGDVVGKRDILTDGDILICRWCYERHEWEKEVKWMVDTGEQQFRDWYDCNFVIVDTESTDLDGEIIEIGMIDRDGNTLFQSLVKPINPVEDDSIATRMHGITNADLENAPTWAEIHSDVQKIMRGRLVLAYNLEFLKSVIMTSNANNDIVDTQAMRCACIMKAVMLTEATERYISRMDASGIPTQYRAIADCKSALEIVKAQWRRLGLSQ